MHILGLTGRMVSVTDILPLQVRTASDRGGGFLIGLSLWTWRSVYDGTFKCHEILIFSLQILKEYK